MRRARQTEVLVGVDVQSIAEVASSLSTYGRRYTRRLFTEDEVRSCGGPVEAAAPGLAARFAAKEAVLKVLDLGVMVPPWRTIEVRESPTGRPEVHLRDEAAALARDQRVERLSLSLSHDGGVAVAAVVAQVSRPRRER